jgi:predicted kinase
MTLPHKPVLILLRGLPGAGKTSFARYLKWVVDPHVGQMNYYEADEWFDIYCGSTFTPGRLKEAHKWCRDRAELALRRGESAVISNTSTEDWEVELYQEIAKKCHAEFVSLIIENRHGGISVHDVPETSINRMRDRFTIKL